MRRLLAVVLLVLLLIGCENGMVRLKKGCDVESGREVVEGLAEVKGKIGQIERLAGANRTYWSVDSVLQENRMYYRYRLQSRLPYADAQLYSFWVPKGDCGQVFLEEGNGSLVAYAELAKSTKEIAGKQQLFPSFFKRFAGDMAFRQQHLEEFLLRFWVEKDGSVLVKEEDLLTDDLNERQTYTFGYYPDGVVCAKNVGNGCCYVFVMVGDTWRLSQIWD